MVSEEEAECGAELVWSAHLGSFRLIWVHLGPLCRGLGSPGWVWVAHRGDWGAAKPPQPWTRGRCGYGSRGSRAFADNHAVARARSLSGPLNMHQKRPYLWAEVFGVFGPFGLFGPGTTPPKEQKKKSIRRPRGSREPKEPQPRREPREPQPRSLRSHSHEALEQASNTPRRGRRIRPFRGATFGVRPLRGETPGVRPLG